MNKDLHFSEEQKWKNCFSFQDQSVSSKYHQQKNLDFEDFSQMNQQQSYNIFRGPVKEEDYQQYHQQEEWPIVNQNACNNYHITVGEAPQHVEQFPSEKIFGGDNFLNASHKSTGCQPEEDDSHLSNNNVPSFNDLSEQYLSSELQNSQNNQLNCGSSSGYFQQYSSQECEVHDDEESGEDIFNNFPEQKLEDSMQIQQQQEQKSLFQNQMPTLQKQVQYNNNSVHKSLIEQMMDYQLQQDQQKQQQQQYYQQQQQLDQQTYQNYYFLQQQQKQQQQQPIPQQHQQHYDFMDLKVEEKSYSHEKEEDWKIINNIQQQQSIAIKSPKLTKKTSQNQSPTAQQTETKNLVKNIGTPLLESLQEHFRRIAPLGEEAVQLKKIKKMKKKEDLVALFKISEKVQIMSIQFLQGMMPYISNSKRIKNKRAHIKYIDIFVQAAIDPDNFKTFKPIFA